MTKKYYIKFITGKEFIGTAKEIVTQLRNESRLLAITPRKYAKLVAKSYEMSTGLKLRTWTYNSFVKSLGKSLMVMEFKEVK
jgi:hypothetical protein